MYVAPTRRFLRSIRKSVQFVANSVEFLVILNIFLIIVIIREYRNKLKDSTYVFPSDYENSSFKDDVLRALDAINIIYGQKYSRSDPDVEDYSRKYAETNWCIFQTPKFQKPDNSGQWTEVLGRRGFLAYLFAAYWDQRPNQIFGNSQGKGTVQILSMVRRGTNASDPYDLYCQLWSQHGQYQGSVKGFARDIWRTSWDPRRRFYNPVLISCPTGSSTNPAFVTLVSGYNTACQSSNYSIRVFPNDPSPQIADNMEQKRQAENDIKVVVCVKGMDFIEDHSWRLIEWIELQKLLGAQKIVIYTYYVHPRTAKVLKYYSAEGTVEQVVLTLPGSAPVDPYLRSRFIWRNRQQKRRNELIPYNDCLYRHLNSHHYLLIVDTDESVVPAAGYGNWSSVLMKWQNQSLRKHKDDHPQNEPYKFTAFSVRNAFFFDNMTTSLDPAVPQHMHMLQHRTRAKTISPPGNYGKSFMYINNVASVFNHFPLHKQHTDLYKTEYVSAEDALKLHYKGSCPVESRDDCPSFHSNVVEDHTLDRYKAVLIHKVTSVGKQLDLLEN